MARNAMQQRQRQQESTDKFVFPAHPLSRFRRSPSLTRAEVTFCTVTSVT